MDSLLARGYKILSMEWECRCCGRIMEEGANVTTDEGIREVGISHMCEVCYEELFEDCDE